MAASTREVYLLLRARDEASRVVRGFSTELLRSANAVRAAALRAQAVSARATAEQMKSSGATQAQIKAVLGHADALDKQASSLLESDRRTRRLVQSMQTMGSTLETLGIGMVVTGGLILGALFSTVSAFGEWERQVKLTQTQVDGFAASFEQISELGLRIANEIPVAFEQIQPALFDIFSSTSANLEQAEILMRAFSKAAVAGQTDIQTAARGTIAIMNGLNIPFEDVNKVMDVQFELVRKGVGTYEEFAKVFGRIIPAANRSQQSFETVAAMLAFMTRNGQSAAMAATAAARSLELLTHPGAIKNLTAFGVQVRDSKGNFLPLIEILRDLRTELNKLPPADRVGKLVEIFKGSGFNIQARRFLEQVLLGKGELEDFEALMLSMGNASGVMEDKYADMANTVVSKTQLLANKWQVLKVAAGEALAPAFLILVDWIGKIVDAFNKASPATRKFIVIAIAIAAALTIVAGVAAIIVGAIAAVVSAFVIAGTEILIVVGILALLASGVGIAAGAFLLAWTQLDGFKQFLKDMKDRFWELAAIVMQFGQKIKESYDKHLKPPLMELKKVLDETVLPAWNRFVQEVWEKARPKIIETFETIGRVFDETMRIVGKIIKEDLIPALQDLSKWWEENKEDVQPFIDMLIDMAKWMSIIIALIVASGLIVAFHGLVTSIKGLIGGVQTAIETFQMMKKSMQDAIDTIKKLWERLTSVGDDVKSAFKDAGQWLVDAGKNMITGLINGIKEKAKDIGGVVSGIVQGIKNFFQYSPAKKGPLSGKGNTFYAGQSISKMLAEGMLDQLGIVQNASSQLAGAVGVPNAGGTGTLAPVGLGSSTQPVLTGMNKNNYVTVNVHTNEIDPRTTATELGFELAGRL